MFVSAMSVGVAAAVLFLSALHSVIVLATETVQRLTFVVATVVILAKTAPLRTAVLS
jgi:hypothetical protein